MERADWNTWLYVALCDEFDQLHKVGLKISFEVLLTFAKILVINSFHILFTIGYLNPRNRVPILEEAQSSLDLIISRQLQYCELNLDMEAYGFSF
jgi:hypothetical protein